MLSIENPLLNEIFFIPYNQNREDRIKNNKPNQNSPELIKEKKIFENCLMLVIELFISRLIEEKQTE